MPPTGNHPVRAANNASISDPSSGGTDTASIEPPPTSTRTIPGGRLPDITPSHNPTGVASNSAETASRAVLRARSPNNSATGRP